MIINQDYTRFWKKQLIEAWQQENAITSTYILITNVWLTQKLNIKEK